MAEDENNNNDSTSLATSSLPNNNTSVAASATGSVVSSSSSSISKGRKKRVGGGSGSSSKSSSRKSSSKEHTKKKDKKKSKDNKPQSVDNIQQQQYVKGESYGSGHSSSYLSADGTVVAGVSETKGGGATGHPQEVVAASQTTTQTTTQTTSTRGRERKQDRGLMAMASRSIRSLSRSRRSKQSNATSAALDISSSNTNRLIRRSTSGNSSENAPGMSNNNNGINYTSGVNMNDDTSSTSSSSELSQNNPTNTEMIITVTSCRSDAYHEGKSLNQISKLPRRAPSALKTFHELAVGIKDAYEAGGCMPVKPPPKKDNSNGGLPTSIGGDSSSGEGGEESDNNKETTPKNVIPQLTPTEWDWHRTLFEFMGNLDFLLALVDEVAIDTATRGALKEDTTFRGLRDVIKKCNKVLDTMLIRRERKYTLMFRIVSVNDSKLLKKISHWNARVEKALGGVTQDYGDDGSSAVSSWRSKVEADADDNASDAGSVVSSISTSSARSSVSAVLRRGRELLPTAGKVRARRATPTPRLRRRRDGSQGASDSSAGEDGYSSNTVAMTTENLAKLQLSLDSGGAPGGGSCSSNLSVATPIPTELHGDKRKKTGSDTAEQSAALGQVKPMKPKDELLDVIRGLRSEQMRARDAIGTAENNRGVNVLDEIKSNFTPKAEIPSAVPKLPIEYIHRHRLMKQVVNCLLDRAGPRDTDDETPFANTITCITSRHSDKAGNGKTTLAVAAIQTVEVREFFSDGIAWIHLGRTPLGEREVRRLYEQLYDQLLGGADDDVADDDKGKDDDGDDNASNSSNSSGDDEDNEAIKATAAAIENEKDNAPNRGVSNLSSASETKLATSRRSFQGGELEGMKEDLGRLLLSRRVLICLDDVCKMEDAKWFLFGTRSDGDNNFEDTPHRVLITTRIPGLVGPGITHEVFVRIFSEHEAVKLLLTAAGRRPNGLPKVSPVFAQARIIVKGCGNSPLALRIAGGMLRSHNRNWTLSSPAWKLLVEQCRTSLEEASRIRSFANSVQRLIDLSFATVIEPDLRSILRECFVTFAMVFHDTDSLKVGKGISRAVVIRLFAVVSSMEGGRLPTSINSDLLADCMDNATLILDTLETMNLVQRAGHDLNKTTGMRNLKDAAGDDEMSTNHSNHKCYSMHESVSISLCFILT